MVESMLGNVLPIFNYFMPIFVFLFVFTLVYAFLSKTKLLGENSFVNMIIGFSVAIIFVGTPMAVNFTNTITPWMIMFFIVLFFMFLIYAFMAGSEGFKLTEENKWLQWVVFVVILAIFIVAGVQAFGPILTPYAGAEGNVTASGQIGGAIKDVMFHPAVLGISLLFLVAAITAWVLGQK